MRRFNIVVEGMDGTGKSVLVSALQAAIHTARVLAFSKNKPENRQELLLSLARDRSEASIEFVNIFDRLSAISEYIYMDNGGLKFDEVIQEIEDCNIDLIVWARRPINMCDVTPRSDDPKDVEYNKLLAARLPDIAVNYEILMPELMTYMINKGKYFEIHSDWTYSVKSMLVQKISCLSGLAR